MKTNATLLLSCVLYALSGNIVNAQSGFVDVRPSCDDPLVRLSIDPIPCKPTLTPIDFDLPAVKLDNTDLSRIFLGAESSGGRVVGPMNFPRVNTPITPFPFELHCSAKVMLDGGKRVSYLSYQQVTLSERTSFFRPSAASWSHALIRGNNIEAPIATEVEVAPVFGLNNLSLEVSFEKENQKLSLNICQQKVFGQSDCAQAEITNKGVEATLISDIKEGKNSAKRTFKVSCQHR